MDQFGNIAGACLFHAVSLMVFYSMNAEMQLVSNHLTAVPFKTKLNDFQFPQRQQGFIPFAISFGENLPGSLFSGIPVNC